MRRTQIYLEEDTFKHLAQESKKLKTTISEIIRQSIKSKIKNNADILIRRMEKVAGIWADKKMIQINISVS